MKKGKVITFLVFIFVFIFIVVNSVFDGYAFFDANNAANNDVSIGISNKFMQSNIYFDSNGGSSVATLTGYVDDPVSEPSEPSKSGYNFDGWYSDMGLTSSYTFSTFSYNDITLYAKWISGVTTITFDSRGGSSVASISQDGGTTISEPSYPTRSGYEFVGWYTDISITQYFDFNSELMPLSDITLYAEWGTAGLQYNAITGGYSVMSGTSTSDNVKIPNRYFGSSILEIGTSAFSGYTNLLSINIPDTVTTIGGSAFLNCSNLPNIYIPINVITIGRDAFKGCSSLTIYAETSAALSGWDSKWNRDNRPVVWSAENYHIYFEVNGGSFVDSVAVPYNSTISLISTSTKTGYTFDGWYLDESLTQIFNLASMPANDLTLYAKWVITTYTITFESNGGSSVADIVAPYNSAISEPSEPSKYGYHFDAWYSDIALTQVYTFTTMPIDGITLYAGWIIGEYTLTFESNGGSTISPITQYYGTTLSQPSDPTKIGYEFGGWYLDQAFTLAYIFDGYMVGEDTTLYARWGLDLYNVTFDSNGGSSVTSQLVEYTSYIIKPDNPIRTGYLFEAWYSDAVFTQLFDFATETMPSNDITLYAKWDLATFTITFDSNGGSSVNPIRDLYGSALTKPSDPILTNYTFINWYSDVSLTQLFDFAVETMPSNDITLYAKWQSNYSTISFVIAGVSVSPITDIIGNSVSAPSTPVLSGYEFVGWYTDVARTQYYTFSVMPSNDLTLYGVWASAGLNYTSITGGYSVSYGSSTQTNIIIPAYYFGTAVIEIGVSGFMASPITSISLPDTIESIQATAFRDCLSLTEIYIPLSVTYVGRDAFKGSVLTIYVEAINEPSTWDSRWNRDNNVVVWGYII